MVAQHYVTADNSETFLSIGHLSQIQMWHNNLDDFWQKWEQINSQLAPDSILPKGLETMLYNQIHKHPDMAQSIKEYERALPGSALKTYEWLKAEVIRIVNIGRMHRNHQERDDRLKEINQGPKTVKAAAFREDSKGKRVKTDASVKKDTQEALAAPQAAPAKGGKGGKSKSEGKTPKGKGGSSGGNQTNGAEPRTEGTVPIHHCYWFHYKDASGKASGCQREPCRFKHDKKISKRSSRP